MPESESPTYYLHLRHKSNCSHIQSIKPGQEKKVLVLREGDITVTPIAAKGIRSIDGKSYSVVVTLPDGSYEILPTWDYAKLLENITELTQE